jgi:hypothetical protein
MADNIGHWNYEGEDFDPDDYFGFVYLISIRNSDGSYTRYIGKKQFHAYVKRKRGKQTKWREYTSSSKHLNDLLERTGGTGTSYEILQLFETRGGLVAGECKVQWYLDVLTEKGDDDVPLYYNRQIGAVKFIPKEAITDETKARLDDLYRSGRVLIQGRGEGEEATETTGKEVS